MYVGTAYIHAKRPEEGVGYSGTGSIVVYYPGVGN